MRLDFAFSTSYLRNISALYYWNVYHKQGMIYGRTLAYSVGADVKAVSEILGHASTSVTLDTYTHLTDEKKRQQEEVVKSIKVL